jgi:hypothetical protein
MENYEVTLSLLGHHVRKEEAYSEELKKALSYINTIFFMEEQLSKHVKEGGIEYIKSDDFQSTRACINSNKMNLINLISSL